MANLKPIRPSLKEKKRYIVFEVHSDYDISPEKLIDAVNKSCLEFMGLLHFGKSGIILLRNQFSKNTGIIKVNNKYVDYVKASLQLISEIDDKKVNIDVIGVSGILKKAREKFSKK